LASSVFKVTEPPYRFTLRTHSWNPDFLTRTTCFPEKIFRLDGVFPAKSSSTKISAPGGVENGDVGVGVFSEREEVTDLCRAQIHFWLRR